MCVSGDAGVGGGRHKLAILIASTVWYSLAAHRGLLIDALVKNANAGGLDLNDCWYAEASYERAVLAFGVRRLTGERFLLFTFRPRRLPWVFLLLSK